VRRRAHSGSIDWQPRRVSEGLSRPRTGLDFLLALGVLLLAGFGVRAGVDARIFTVAQAGPAHPAGILVNALDHLSLRTWDEVASMQGDVTKLANADTGARYRIDLAVSQASLGLLQIQAVLVDRRLGREVDRLVTYRSKPR